MLCSDCTRDKALVASRCLTDRNCDMPWNTGYATALSENIENDTVAENRFSSNTPSTNGYDVIEQSDVEQSHVSERNDRYRPSSIKYASGNYTVLIVNEPSPVCYTTPD